MLMADSPTAATLQMQMAEFQTEQKLNGLSVYFT